ncbi:monovalent cation:proton antiporter-2 (CPA2) family protein [Bergeyella zoohelcum]|uniref:Monovalent cation:proton antiporter-2 (CPA2) family transporter n=3 Tax=Bergeyella zoohelcum TaxID=1015 RepID=K1LGZ1_9FLAO|nr:monovalent cation:proton antiporter-2 (CPA2) family protein [Bergeyella zoohelcum]EKB55920.1 monovalent cation:proton antiporter-2 (CPA2) family transporter [Bergeyella zoohelcum ATCC 43767]SUV50356.1 K(+)/H(+) antiporter [Bergeyella zoohelcum]VDH02566.1 sodium/hydrogen exchanger family protein [Bergeyella zoohelcum]
MAEETQSAHSLLNVVVLIGTAVLAVPLFKKLGLGSVLGYLAAGLVLGPFGLKLFQDTQSIMHLAELGVVMFLFVIGLEMKPAHLWGLRKQIFGMGSMQALILASILTLLGLLYGLPWQTAFVAISGFVLSSTAIVMQILGERHELATPRGQKVVSILLFEDLLIVPLLAIVAFLAPVDPNAVVQKPPVWQQLGTALLSLGILVAAGLWLLNPLFRILAKSKAREVMTGAALFVVLGAALLMEWGGISMAMGAFTAGVLLSESSFRHQLETDIEPFRGLLLGLFFLGVGMSLNLEMVAENLWMILLGVLSLMTIKSSVVYLVARLSKSNKTDAIDRALLMSQGGEFAFVLYAAAASQGVIDSTLHANMTAIVVISMALTPIFILIYQKFIRKKTVDLDGVDHILDDENSRGNVLIIGFGRMGQIASQVPLAYGATVTIIDNNPDTIRSAQKHGLKVYYGDGSREDVLYAAGAYHADCVMICLDDSAVATQIVRSIKHHSPTTKTVVRASDHHHAFELIEAEADFFVRETFEAAVDMGGKTLKALGADEEDVEKYNAQIRNTDKQKYALETKGDEFSACEMALKNAEGKR